ncbi:CbrC family protein [Chryseobacterium gregarium]|uniref:CbrC family protein n=1 Tax=Chryseobacterium gregarium TaxID=456299 RepID=UPI00048284A2|nr:CbrC family protein [Chryseobacterium gregarium]
MELPKFKYSPNAYGLDIFEKAEGTCSVCNEKRQMKYTGSFYSTEDPEYICPWCITNGKASEKYDGEFNDYCGIEGISPDPNDPAPAIPKELLLEITNRTPGYSSWQQEVWLTHCNEPCAFIGYADTQTIEPIAEELNDDIDNNGYDPELIRTHLSKDGSLVGYLFRCVNCGKHRLHVDCD